MLLFLLLLLQQQQQKQKSTDGAAVVAAAADCVRCLLLPWLHVLGIACGAAKVSPVSCLLLLSPFPQEWVEEQSSDEEFEVQTEE